MSELPIGIETKVIVTDQNGKSREGTVINQDNGKYLVNFPDTSMSEFWSPKYVRVK
jgi:hypothetical protein